MKEEILPTSNFRLYPFRLQELLKFNVSWRRKRAGCSTPHSQPLFVKTEKLGATRVERFIRTYEARHGRRASSRWAKEKEYRGKKEEREGKVERERERKKSLVSGRYVGRSAETSGAVGWYAVKNRTNLQRETSILGGSSFIPWRRGQKKRAVRERKRAEVLEAHFSVKNRETARRELSSAVRSSAKWGG